MVYHLRKWAAAALLTCSLLVTGIELLYASCSHDLCDEVEYSGYPKTPSGPEYCQEWSTDGADGLLAANTTGTELKTTYGQLGGTLETHPKIDRRRRLWSVCNFPCTKGTIDEQEVAVSGSAGQWGSYDDALYCDSDGS